MDKETYVRYICDKCHNNTILDCDLNVWEAIVAEPHENYTDHLGNDVQIKDIHGTCHLCRRIKDAELTAESLAVVQRDRAYVVSNKCPLCNMETDGPAVNQLVWEFIDVPQMDIIQKYSIIGGKLSMVYKKILHEKCSNCSAVLHQFCMEKGR